MRHYDPTDTFDADEFARLNAAPWMTALLAVNPSYCGWGPHEDYMCATGEGWNSRRIIPTWAEANLMLDDLNEVVNFYFSVERDSEDCADCGGSGYHPDARWIADSFYGHSTPFRPQTPNEREAERVMQSFGSRGHDRLPVSFPTEEVLARYGSEFRIFCESMRAGDGTWNRKITQDEADALVASGRCGIYADGAWTHPQRTAEDINAAQLRGALDSHDAINRGILIRARCERMGIPLECPRCDGHGSIYTEPSAHVALTLWVLHPRKGASRGIEVSRIEESDLPAVFGFLRTAAARNADRFAKVPR